MTGSPCSPHTTCDPMPVHSRTALSCALVRGPTNSHTEPTQVTRPQLSSHPQSSQHDPSIQMMHEKLRPLSSSRTTQVTSPFPTSALPLPRSPAPSPALPLPPLPPRAPPPRCLHPLLSQPPGLRRYHPARSCPPRRRPRRTRTPSGSCRTAGKGQAKDGSNIRNFGSQGGRGTISKNWGNPQRPMVIMSHAAASRCDCTVRTRKLPGGGG